MTVVLSATATIPSGTAVDATVYEDTDGDGIAENQQIIRLVDGVGDYQFTALTGDSTNDYWVQFGLETGDAATTPTVDSASLDTTPPSPNSELTTDVTLNSQRATATVYEDTDGDGTAENRITVPLPGGTATTGVHSVEGSTSYDYWVRFDLDTSDTTATPTVNSASLDTTLTVTDAGSITAASATAVSGQETATLSETPSVTAGAATAVSADEAMAGADAGTVTAAAATVQTTTTLVEDFIAGTVTLSGSGVQGAKVYVINAENDTVEGTATTDTNGDYGVTVPADPPYHIAVQYDDGSQKYNALSKPFVE